MIFGPVLFSESSTNRKGFNLLLLDHLEEDIYLQTILNLYNNGDILVSICVDHLCLEEFTLYGEDLNG